MHPFKIAALLICAMALFSSCNKVTCIDDRDKDLTGTWDWLSTDGGLANHIHETPTSTGVKKQVTFTADGKYRFFTNGTLASEGTFTTVEKDCIHSEKQKLWIQFSANPEQNRMIESLESDMLLLSDEAYDGLNTKYARVNNRVQ